MGVHQQTSLTEEDQGMEPGLVHIHRPSYSRPKFDETFGYQEEVTTPLKQRVRDLAKAKCSLANLLSFFPFINVLRTYKWKSWIIKDILAGLTVGVIHVPQSLGFALLTQVAPVYGLYSSFYPVVIYFFLGTSRHISVGTMAVISLMIGTVVQQQSAQADICIEPSNGTESPCGQFRADIAMSVSLIAGAVQLIMSFLQLGVISMLMSQPFVGGFTAGAVFHIVTSQVKSLLGLPHLRPVSGMFKLPITYYEVFRIITQTNVTELVISIITLTILVGVKEGINEKFKNKLKIPIPIELLVVVTAILITHFALLPKGFRVDVVGKIPLGFPAPKVPSMTNATSYIVDGFLVGLVGFVISISLAKIFQTKYNYQIDDNQELFAYGMCNFVGAFFSSFAGAVAPPRCFAHESSGGKSQVASIVSALLIMLVILVIAPLFSSLPKSVLGCIIIAALVPVFKSFAILKPLWKLNKGDFLVWLLTWAAVTFLNVDIGLGIGIGLSIIMPALHSLFLARGRTLGRAVNSELYAHDKNYTELQKLRGIYIFRFEYPLFYITAERFKKQIYEQTVKPDPPKKDKGLKNAEKNKTVGSDAAFKEKEANFGPAPVTVIKLTNDDEKGWKEKEFNEDAQTNTQTGCRLIILDLSAVSYVDVVGVNTLKLVNKEYTANDIKLVIVSTVEDVRLKLQRGGVGICQYPSIEDAVVDNLSEPLWPDKGTDHQTDLSEPLTLDKGTNHQTDLSEPLSLDKRTDHTVL